jgi:hypothetical protein
MKLPLGDTNVTHRPEMRLDQRGVVGVENREDGGIVALRLAAWPINAGTHRLIDRSRQDTNADRVALVRGSALLSQAP